PRLRREPPACSRISIVANLQQLDFENQSLVRLDIAGGAFRTVGQFGWNEESKLRSFLHQLQAFLPALDDPFQRQLRRLAAPERAVKCDAVNERAAIVDRHGILQPGGFAGSFCQNEVLQPTPRAGNPRLRRVLFEECVAEIESGLGHGDASVAGKEWREDLSG